MQDAQSKDLPHCLYQQYTFQLSGTKLSLNRLKL